ncbi:MAG: NERD domain-containing protein [Psychrobacter sp.]|nr:NERD domain-containing protein [Psychrobacter sp.]
MRISNAIKGAIGELKVRFVVWSYLGFTHKTLNNVTIELPNNRTSQIDHILISCYGIFVIETKNFKGDITIDESSGYWTQSFNSISYQFYSPIRQNSNHIRSLKYLLEDKDYPYFNVVCFVGSASFRQDVLPQELSVGMLKAVELIMSKDEEVLSKEEVAIIIEKIKKDRMPNNRHTKRLHLKNIKANKPYY